MKLTDEDRAALRSSFRKMSLAAKVEYIFMYFRLPIFLGLVALALLCSGIYRQLTKKEAVLYAGCVNVAIGDTLETYLDSGFIASIGEDSRKSRVFLYPGLYLSNAPTQENHQYSYASRLKVTAAIEAKELDIVLMNRESYDILSGSGYLYDLSDLMAENPALYTAVEPWLTTNTVIVEDNAVEYQLGEAAKYEAVTRESKNGVEISAFPPFDQSGFSDRVYFGIIANTPRLPAALQYVAYLTGPADEAQG